LENILSMYFRMGFACASSSTIPITGSRHSKAETQQSTIVNSSLIKYGISAYIGAVAITLSLSSFRYASAILDSESAIIASAKRLQSFLILYIINRLCARATGYTGNNGG